MKGGIERDEDRYASKGAGDKLSTGSLVGDDMYQSNKFHFTEFESLLWIVILHLVTAPIAHIHYSFPLVNQVHATLGEHSSAPLASVHPH